jgi:fermentation-respiration switch protein FrsA (DUF1100 family)
VLRSGFLEHPAFDHAVGFHLAQGLRQHLLRDARQPAAQHSLLTLDALGAADLLGATPLLVVHGRKDAYCAPEPAQQLHERTPGAKELRWLDCQQHIDLYDTEPYVSQAVEATAGFLHRSLPGGLMPGGSSPMEREAAHGRSPAAT